MNGYLSSLYAYSLSEFGSPLLLPRSRAWILERSINGFPWKDAMGCYPLFGCQDWLQLPLDLDEISHDFVCLSVVTDPFGHYGVEYLQQCFRDLVIPYKEHFVIDLNLPKEKFVSKHHWRNADKALKSLDVERCDFPIQFLNDWVELYDNLIRKHRIKGIRAFSLSSFSKQLKVPGIVAFRAVYEQITVGMLLWYIQGEVGYYHLGAYTDRGYTLRASFALFWIAIQYFAEIGLQWLSLGAGAGLTSNIQDGLSRFKHGWSTGTRVAYLCGRIFNHTRYEEIMRTKGIPLNKYFPAYRRGEFGED